MQTQYELRYWIGKQHNYTVAAKATGLGDLQGQAATLVRYLSELGATAWEFVAVERPTAEQQALTQQRLNNLTVNRYRRPENRD